MQHAGENISILLVDDQRVNLMHLEGLLSGLDGINILKAESGEKALEIAGREDLALVLLDVMMPELSGFETAERIREIPGKENLPIIFVTAVGTEEQSIFKGYQSGAVDYLIKPFPPELLLSKVSVFASLYRQQKELEATSHALEVQLHRMRLLNRITRAVTEGKDLEDIASTLLEQLEEYFHIDAGMFCMLEEHSEECTTLISRSKEPGFWKEMDITPGVMLPLDDFGLKSCLACQTLYEPETAKTQAPIQRNIAGQGLHSLLAVPLSMEGSVHGTLILCRKQPHGFSQDERRFLLNLSEQVALAMHQTKLFEELQSAYLELRSTQKAVLEQERLRALGQMASGVAHDINNALSPITGYTDLLLTDRKNFDDDQTQFLRAIQTASRDISATVERMRDFYRKRDDEEVLFPVDLNEVIHHVVDLTRPRWSDMPQQKGISIDIEFNLEPDLPKFSGVESEIREAVTNLILNAVDAMPEGGTITLSTEKHGDEIVLEVADEGTGMDEKTIQHSIEPFFTTKGKEGTGLGMSLIFGVMQRHDGDLQVESQKGRGSSIRLKFPSSDTSFEKTDPEFPPEVLAPCRILFIDDQKALRDLIKEMLSRDGHTVTVAASGEEGISVFASEHSDGNNFDVVITDLGMPFIDGREVARAIKKISSRTPVIMLTGWGNQLKSQEQIPENIDAVLSKPPTLNKLRRTLRKVRTP